MEKKYAYIGVDFGGTNIRAGRVANGVLEVWESLPTPQETKSSQEAIDTMTEVIRKVWNEEVEGVGIGVPSVVDRKRGIVYDVANVPHWDEVRLKDILENSFPVPVCIDNDANCFALGERFFGVGREFENFVGLTLGTGLGGGIIQRGRLLDDANCGSGEFGYLPYRDHILEYYCSGSYFKNIWGVNGKIMQERALQGDPEAVEAFRQLGIHIAAAVKVVLLTLDPQMIVFGGSVAASHPLFEKSMYENLEDFPYPNSVRNLQIRFSTMEHPGILGAASLCMQPQN